MIHWLLPQGKPQFNNSQHFQHSTKKKTFLVEKNPFLFQHRHPTYLKGTLIGSFSSRQQGINKRTSASGCSRVASYESPNVEFPPQREPRLRRSPNHESPGRTFPSGKWIREGWLMVLDGLKQFDRFGYFEYKKWVDKSVQVSRVEVALRLLHS